MSGMRSYNPEQIMLSAVVRRPSRDVDLMKEKLIFSGETEHTAVWR
ncbi:Glycerophosphodiester phosphodiesterase domain-containing protein 5 [Labeo rohita]|uniref:Glycerophosphodiester phosphodiesterase domain-containing protein 5 n=1 Tax=Labeo rohita TaxID=84645 RepID=A0ABQ8LCY8_LABRO|nr:Glycerophosphodiester phosphodiesterase domain-containing protein 5 [Labeo rohita]